MEFNAVKTHAKTFILRAKQNQFLQENFLNKFPVRRIAVALNTNSAFTGSHTENPFWYQQFDLRLIKILRRSQPIVDFETADNCRLYVTAVKAMSFQGDFPSIPIDNFKDNYVLVWNLTSIQNATGKYYEPKLVGESLRLIFTFPREYVTELIVLRERMSAVRVDKFGVVGKTFKMDNVSLQ